MSSAKTIRPVRVAPANRSVVDGRTARRNTTRTKIIVAAAELFSEAGVVQVSIDDVCAAAGVSKGSVFYNFQSKDGLFEAVIENGIDEIAHAITAGRAGQYGAEALDMIAEEVLLLVSREHHLCRVAWTELFRIGRPWNTRVQGFRGLLLHPMTEVMQEIELQQLSRGAISPTPPLDAFEASAMAFLGGLISSALDHLVYRPDVPLRYVHSALITSFAVRAD